VTSVLFVCTGNICRSPVAERIARQIAAEYGVAVSFTSAGVGAMNGAPMHPLAAETLVEHGYDPSGFGARYLQPPIAAQADLVLTMSRRQRGECQKKLPAGWKKMFTLNEFVELLPDADSIVAAANTRGWVNPNAEYLDIADPMGQPKEAFDTVFIKVEPRVRALVGWLAATSQAR